MRLGEDVGHAHDGRVGNVVAAQLLHGLLERAGGEPLLGEAEDHVEVLRAVLRAGEPRVTR